MGDKVLLSSKNLRTLRPSKKLSGKFLGPFEVIEKKGRLAYKLALPESMARHHPVFHVCLLEPYRGRPGYAPEVVPEDTAEDIDSHYEVEEIVDHKNQGKTTLYCVKWLGYGPEENSWATLQDLENAESSIKEYWARRAAT